MSSKPHTPAPTTTAPAFKLDPIAIGERIKQRRAERGETQKDVGKACGLSQNSVMKIERGQTENSRFVAAIWVHLGLDLTELSDIYRQRPASEFDPNSSGFSTVEVVVPRKVLQLTQVMYEAVTMPTGGSGKGIMITWVMRNGATISGVLDQSMIPEAERRWREVHAALDADPAKS